MMQAKVPKTILKQSNVWENRTREVHPSSESTAGLTSSEKLFSGVNSAHLYPRRGRAMKHIVYPKAHGGNADVGFYGPFGMNVVFGIKARTRTYSKT
jgi:hypothetical protein